MTFNRPQNDNSDVQIGINVVTNKQALQASERDVKAFKKTLNDSFAPDNAKVQQAKKQFADQRRDIELTRRAAERTTSVYTSWGKVLGDIDRANYIDSLTAELVKAQKSGQDLDTTLEGVKARLQEIGASEGEVRRVISGAQAATGGGQGAALQALGREARVALPAVGIPGTGISTEGAARFVEVAGRAQQAFSQLSPALKGATVGTGALGIGLIALAKGFDAINEQFARQTRAIIGGQEEVTRLRLQGNREEIQAAIDAKNAEDDITRARIEENKRLLAAVEEGAGGVGAALADVLNIAGVQELRKNTQELEQSLATNAIATGRLTGLLGEEGVQARLTAEAIEALRKARQDEIDELARTEVQLRATFSQIAGGTAESARGRLASITAEREALNTLIQRGELSGEAVAEFATRLNELGQEFGIVQELLPALEDAERIKKANEDAKDAQQQLTQLAQRAIDIQTQGEERINRIREQGLKQVEAAEKRLSTARQKLVDFDAEAAEKAADIDRKFMRADIERLDEFRRRERRINRDADIQRLRDLEDHRNSLLDAEQANDVAAFIAEQRRFKTEQSRKRQDEQTAADDRLDDLELEREKARQTRDERLAILQAETDKKRADLQAEIAERANALAEVKKQIADRVKAEQNAIQKSLRNLVTSFDSSTQRMTQILQQGFAVLECAGINTFAGIIEDLRRRARLLNQTTTPPQTTNFPSSSGGGGAVAFAPGGIVTKPTVALLGERRGYHEAVIPFRPADGIAKAIKDLGLGGGGNTNYNFAGMFSGASIGGDVTRADLDAVTQAVYMGINALTTGQAPGAA